jgi:hypothetical protein
MLRVCRRRSDRIGYAVMAALPARTRAAGTEVAHADADNPAAMRDALSAICRAGWP